MSIPLSCEGGPQVRGSLVKSCCIFAYVINAVLVCLYICIGVEMCYCVNVRVCYLVSV